MTHTRTYVILEVSPAAFAEIEQKLRAADYGHAFATDEGKLTIDMHGIALKAKAEYSDCLTVDEMKQGVHAEWCKCRECTIKKAFDQARLLLHTVSIRTAPQSLKELAQSSSMATRNAAYLHPDVLRRFGLDATPGVRLVNVLGSTSLVVCTPLLPPFGVIYGPLYDLFLSDEQTSEEFKQHWNVAELHRHRMEPRKNLLPQRTPRNTEEVQG